MSARLSALGLVCVSVAAILAASGSSRAGGQGKLEVHYTASLAGIPLGTGVWTVDVVDDQYAAAATGKTTGLLQVFASGQGSADGRGTVNGGKPVSSSYAATITAGKRRDDVRILVSSGTVKDYSALPPWPPTPDRVPVTDAHRRGIIDPMTAWLMPVPGNGDPVRPEACQRTLAIFDGRARYDLALSFKRMDQVKSEHGYAGPVVVCMVRYLPISGHRPDRPAIKYLMEQRDIELALAPLAGTRIVVPYRISVPTALGMAVLEATHFITATQAGRPTPETTSARTF